MSRRVPEIDLFAADPPGSDPLDEAERRLDNLCMEALGDRFGIAPPEQLPPLPPDADLVSHLWRENHNMAAALRYTRTLASALAEAYVPEFRKAPRGRPLNVKKAAGLFADLAWERARGSIESRCAVLASPEGPYADRYPGTDAGTLARTYYRQHGDYPELARLFDGGGESARRFVHLFALKPPDTMPGSFCQESDRAP